MHASTEMLMQEHRKIEQVLDALERFARGLESPGDAERHTLGRFVTFLRQFADRTHHGKEEDLLFQAMTRHGMPVDGGPIGMMLQEHDMGRELVGILAGVAEGNGAWTAEETQRATSAALDFCHLLRQHIQKEDQVLYPMAEQILPPEALNELLDAYQAFEKEHAQSVRELLAVAGSLTEA